MTISCEIDVAERYGKLAGREAGARARAYILVTLKTCPVVSINLRGTKLTPSFADECLGRLLDELGVEEFRQRIKVVEVPPLAAPLLHHVLSRRASQRPRSAAG